MVGVLVQPREPSSLSVTETMFQVGQEMKDEEKLTQKVQRTTGRKTKQEQLKRLHRAQVMKPEHVQLLQSGANQEPVSDAGLIFWSVFPDGPEETAAGGRKTETAGGERSNGGEAPERRNQ